MEPLQKHKYTRYLFFTLLVSFFFIGGSCDTNSYKLPTTLKYIIPIHASLHIVATSDTIRFKLHESMYNDIKSFNTFSTENQEYVAFHDARSNTLNVYNLVKQSLVKRIDFKKSFSPIKLAKSSAFMLNKDSIVLYNNEDIYLLNSNADIIQTVNISKVPSNISPKINMKCIPFLKGTYLYFGLQSLETLMYKKKRTDKIPLICAINLLNNQISFYYYYPKVYRLKNWGYYFSNYSYCINEKKNLVFSFPADSNIYETDLETFNIEYTGRSKLDNNISQKETHDLSSVTEDFNAFQKQQSYGQIYFNPTTGYYLRIFRDNKDFGTGNQKNKSIIILDKNLRIIGESRLEDQTYLNSAFINSRGDLYTRIMNKDEYNLNFLKLKIIP